MPTLLLFGASMIKQYKGSRLLLQYLGCIYLVGYTLKSFYLAYAVNFDAPFKAKHISEDVLYIGQIMAFAGVLAFVLAYVLTPKRVLALDFKLAPQRRFHFYNTQYKALLILSVFLIVSYFYRMGFLEQLMTLNFVSTRFYIIEETGQRSALGFLLIGADMILVYTIYNYALSKSFPLVSLINVAFLFILLCYFMAGQRFAIVMILVAFFLMRNIRGDAGVLKVIYRVAAVVGLIVVLSYASQIRTEREGVRAADLDALVAMRTTVEHVMEGSYAIDPAKLTAMHVKDNEFLLGSSFYALLVAPIPRVFWPGKPVIRIGPYVAQEILDFNNLSGAPPSAIGEFYINFSWFGVVFGMAFLGILAARVLTLFYRKTDAKLALVRQVLFMVCLSNFMIGDFVFAALAAIKYTFAAYICEKYWHNNPRLSRLY